MEKRGDISKESTPTDKTTDAIHGATKQTPAPPPLLKKGESSSDEHPTASELRDGLADSPTRRLADRAADKLK